MSAFRPQSGHRKLADVARPDPLRDEAGWDVPLDALDPDPGRQRALHRRQHMDGGLGIIRHVPARAPVVVQGGARQDQGGVDLEKIRPEIGLFEDAPEVGEVPGRVHSREARA